MKTRLVICLLCISGVSRGQVWTQIFQAPGGGIGDEDVEAIFADNSGRLYVGTDTTAFTSFDNGLTWLWDTSSIVMPDEFSFEELHDGTLLAGCEISGVFRSSDYGLHWHPSRTGLPDSGTVRGIVSDYSLGLFGSVYGSGIYYSSDEGNQWELRSNGLPNPFISSVIRSPNGDLYAALLGFIVRSTDGGLHWLACDTLRSTDEVVTLGADSAGDIFAGIYPGMVLRSRDSGATWDTISPPQPPTLPAVRCITTARGLLFVGTYGTGIWRSSDLGDHWTQMNEGLLGNDLKVLCCTVSGDSDLFIGTLTASVFRTDILSPSSVQPDHPPGDGITFSAKLSASGVTLHFVLPEEQQIELSLYDEAGRQIETLCSGHFTAGDHAVLLGSDQTKFGAYFAVLTTPSGRLAQPVHFVP